MPSRGCATWFIVPAAGGDEQTEDWQWTMSWAREMDYNYEIFVRYLLGMPTVPSKLSSPFFLLFFWPVLAE